MGRGRKRRGRTRRSERRGGERRGETLGQKTFRILPFPPPSEGLVGRVPQKGGETHSVILGIRGEGLVVCILLLVGRHPSRRRNWAVTPLLLWPVWPSEQHRGRSPGRWWPWPHLQAVHLDMNNTVIAGHERPGSESPHSWTLHTESTQEGKKWFPSQSRKVSSCLLIEGHIKTSGL